MFLYIFVYVYTLTHFVVSILRLFFRDIHFQGLFTCTVSRWIADIYLDFVFVVWMALSHRSTFLRLNVWIVSIRMRNVSLAALDEPTTLQEPSIINRKTPCVKCPFTPIPWHFYWFDLLPISLQTNPMFIGLLDGDIPLPYFRGAAPLIFVDIDIPQKLYGLYPNWWG